VIFVAYTKTNWINGVTPLNATNLNKIEQGIYDASAKADTADAKANAALPASEFNTNKILSKLEDENIERFKVGEMLDIESTNVKIGKYATMMTQDDGLSSSVIIGNCAAEGLTPMENSDSNVIIGCDTVVMPITQIRRSVIIGSLARPSGNAEVNEIVIGHMARGYGSNTAHIGNSNVVSISYGAGTGTMFTNRSDRRLKEDIQDADLSICYDSVKKLKLRRFKYKEFVGNERDIHLTGFIADEFGEVFPKAVIKRDQKYPVLDENGDPVIEDGKPKLQEIKDCASIDTSQVVPTLLGAVQKLMAKVEKLETEIAELKKGS
jgi:hypothetical protein